MSNIPIKYFVDNPDLWDGFLNTIDNTGEELLDRLAALKAENAALKAECEAAMELIGATYTGIKGVVSKTVDRDEMHTLFHRYEAARAVRLGMQADESA